MSRKLSAERFAAARRFIEANARPLEQARFRHAFAGGSAEAVLEALGEFRNEDGGFGRPLEPDLRATASSALATSIALQIAGSVGATADSPLVAGAVSYLLRTRDRSHGGWRIIPLEAERSPHAPWWNQSGRMERFEAFSLNPTAEILGYLHAHRSLVSNDQLRLVTNAVADHLLALKQIEMHDLLCCVRLVETTALPAHERERLMGPLRKLADTAIESRPSEWAGYCLRPLQVVTSPDSPFLPGREQAVAANLDYEIETQSEDGSWKPTWTWGGSFPNEEAEALREWAGCLTLERLLLLGRFGRIEK